MTDITYPERDLNQENDLEVYFLIRKAGMDELMARRYLNAATMNDEMEMDLERIRDSEKEWQYHHL